MDSEFSQIDRMLDEIRKVFEKTIRRFSVELKKFKLIWSIEQSLIAMSS